MTWAMRCSDDGSARHVAWLWGNDTCTEPHRRSLDRHICVALVEGCRLERALGPCLVPPCLDQQAAHGHALRRCRTRHASAFSVGDALILAACMDAGLRHSAG